MFTNYSQIEHIRPMRAVPSVPVCESAYCTRTAVRFGFIHTVHIIILCKSGNFRSKSAGKSSRTRIMHSFMHNIHKFVPWKSPDELLWKKNTALAILLK